MPRLQEDIVVKGVGKNIPLVKMIKLGRTYEYAVIEQTRPVNRFCHREISELIT